MLLSTRRSQRLATKPIKSYKEDSLEGGSQPLDQIEVFVPSRPVKRMKMVTSHVSQPLPAPERVETPSRMEPSQPIQADQGFQPTISLPAELSSKSFGPSALPFDNPMYQAGLMPLGQPQAMMQLTDLPYGYNFHAGGGQSQQSGQDSAFMSSAYSQKYQAGNDPAGLPFMGASYQLPYRFSYFPMEPYYPLRFPRHKWAHSASTLSTVPGHSHGINHMSLNLYNDHTHSLNAFGMAAPAQPHQSLDQKGRYAYPPLDHMFMPVYGHVNHNIAQGNSMHQALGPVHRHSIPGRHAYPEVSSQRFAPLPSYPEYASASNGVVAIPRPKPSIQLADIDPALYQNEATDPVTPRHGHTPQLVLRSATATANLVSDAASSSPVITEESESSQVEIPEPNDDKESIHPYKELPSGKPLVWSAKRQGLCEAVPYYRSYKGSLYPIEKVAAGYLIDAETDPGDVFDAQIIISSVGGGRTRDRETNTMVRLEDIPDDTLQVQAFKAAMELNRLVALIAGERNKLYPCRPPAPYAVLDYFRVTDLWKQKMVSTGATNGYVWVWRMRFEKANLSTPSWWMPAGKEMPATADLTIRAPVKECAFCRQATKEMFEVGWFCMNQHCPNNYTLAGGTEVDWQAPLKHTEAFLNERTPSPGSVPSLVPEMVDDTTLHGTEMACRRGFVCPLCGCCNRRIFWNRLVCENSDCGWERLAAMKPYPSETLDQENQVFDERTLRTTNRNDVNLDVVDFYHQDIHATMHIKQIIPHSHSIDFGSHIARQYFLPDAEGKIIGSFTIFSATKETNAQPGGPDELFRNLELQDFGLRRNPAAVAGTKYEGLTRHFQMNFGARYKFGVTVQSKGFNEAPAQILMALQRLIWAKNQAVMYSNAFIGSQDAATVSQSALLGDHQDFNELLALGYMEEDRIRYHDDGEDELGPIVSALALGSPCLMSFRPKAKQQFPESLKKGSQPKKDPKKKCEFHDVLQVRMKHGDMMVMAGTEIQKVYEHTVIPQGNRRFALTARYIDPTKMASQEDREDAITKGAVPDWARQFEYQGN